MVIHHYPQKYLGWIMLQAARSTALCYARRGGRYYSSNNTHKRHRVVLATRDIPDELLNELQAAQNKLCTFLDLRLVDPETFHISMCYFRPLTPHKFRLLPDKVNALPFKSPLNYSTTFFTFWECSNTVALQLNGSPETQKFLQKCGTSLSYFRTITTPKNTPHITIAKGNSTTDVELLQQMLSTLPTYERTFESRIINLYRGHEWDIPLATINCANSL